MKKMRYITTKDVFVAIRKELARGIEMKPGGYSNIRVMRKGEDSFDFEIKGSLTKEQAMEIISR